MANLFKSCIDCEDRKLYCHSTCEQYNRDKKIRKDASTLKREEAIFSIIPARDRKLPQK